MWSWWWLLLAGLEVCRMYKNLVGVWKFSGDNRSTTTQRSMGENSYINLWLYINRPPGLFWGPARHWQKMGDLRWRSLGEVNSGRFCWSQAKPFVDWTAIRICHGFLVAKTRGILSREIPRGKGDSMAIETAIHRIFSPKNLWKKRDQNCLIND